MEDVNIQFEGFSPSGFVRGYFKDVVEELRNEAPSWATVRATIHRAEHHFRGVLRITSQAGEFFAIADADRVHDLGRMLTTRMRRQLGKWKATRFPRDTIRNPFLWKKPESEEE